MEELEYEMSIKDIMLALQKRWLMITAITVSFLIAGGIYFFMFGPEPTYESSTTVLVNYRQDAETTLTQNDITTSQKLVRTYNEIIKSLTILEPVIDKLKLELTPEELLKKINVSQVNETEIIKIMVKDEDAVLAKDIANTIADVFSRKIYSIMKVDSTSTLDLAKVAIEPLPQGRTTKVAIAGILGMMISVGLVFLFEYLDRSLKTADEVERALSIPVIGVIPDTTSKNKRK